jgi:hypothetical protein
MTVLQCVSMTTESLLDENREEHKTGMPSPSAASLDPDLNGDARECHSTLENFGEVFELVANARHATAK